MTLHINNSEYSEERKNSQPLSLEEQNEVVDFLSNTFEAMSHQTIRRVRPEISKLQRLLYHYENLQEEVNRLRDKANAYDELMKQKQ